MKFLEMPLYRINLVLLNEEPLRPKQTEKNGKEPCGKLRVEGSALVLITRYK
jgi:hypothetical protein